MKISTLQSNVFIDSTDYPVHTCSIGSLFNNPICPGRCSELIFQVACIIQDSTFFTALLLAYPNQKRIYLWLKWIYNLGNHVIIILIIVMLHHNASANGTSCCHQIPGCHPPDNQLTFCSYFNYIWIEYLNLKALANVIYTQLTFNIHTFHNN